ncbi:iron-sulfur cluster carrier protein ApbC [Echinimonas agarilytica]|uniref:Iron-sulfur cluster carrier protein n=1 Tax=Echinimonas agarilytica TaxID=1215918 RepID=A0AA41W7J8_9GAMM|nr:iron-sulfur cluster carrier protein ApbC [Echinimonas agarilytica]MCM2680640.1 iron-sulfur cluster carrier protein ApbC [Echinimonas agarilytica]
MSTLELVLSNLIEPVSGLTLSALNAVKSIEQQHDKISVELEFPFANGQFESRLSNDQRQQLEQAVGSKSIDWQVTHAIEATAGERLPNLSNVKNIIAISSGKGGVGKSTTAVNLALALKAEGASVALLDADIYGPSLPLMLGCENEKPGLPDGKQMMIPVSAHGLIVNSVGFLVPDDTATVWRGPMAAGVLQQLLRDTIWGDVDYLVVDMPPGTGDIQLTLAQVVPVSAAVIVTTPQTIALADAVKGIAMYNKVNVPVAGVIENMSYHLCSNCGHHDYLFGQDGGQRIAAHYEVPLLGALPLDKVIGDDVEAGEPTVIATPESALSRGYHNAAVATAAQLWQLSANQSPVVSIDASDD